MRCPSIRFTHASRLTHKDDLVMKYSLQYFFGVTLFTGSLLFMPMIAQAGPLGCANAIKGCVGGGQKVAEKIKKSRQACEALRDCKKVCKENKKDTKRQAKNDKKSCTNSCKSLKGKKKRECKRNCRKDKRSTKKNARKDKRSCVQVCRDNYKTKSCKKARFSMATTIAAQGLKCAAQVTAQCGPTAP